MTNKVNEEKVESISKDLCWYDGGGPKCEMDCNNCKAGHFKKFKWIVRFVLKKIGDRNEKEKSKRDM